MKEPNWKENILEESEENNLQIILKSIIQNLYELDPNDFIDFLTHQLKVIFFNSICNFQ